LHIKCPKIVCGGGEAESKGGGGGADVRLWGKSAMVVGETHTPDSNIKIPLVSQDP